jgi:hypothetical protein
VNWLILTYLVLDKHYKTSRRNHYVSLNVQQHRTISEGRGEEEELIRDLFPFSVVRTTKRKNRREKEGGRGVHLLWLSRPALHFSWDPALRLCRSFLRLFLSHKFQLVFLFSFCRLTCLLLSEFPILRECRFVPRAAIHVSWTSWV